MLKAGAPIHGDQVGLRISASYPSNTQYSSFEILRAHMLEHLQVCWSYDLTSRCTILSSEHLADSNGGITPSLFDWPPLPIKVRVEFAIRLERDALLLDKSYRSRQDPVYHFNNIGHPNF